MRRANQSAQIITLTVLLYDNRLVPFRDGGTMRCLALLRITFMELLNSDNRHPLVVDSYWPVFIPPSPGDRHSSEALPWRCSNVNLLSIGLDLIRRIMTRGQTCSLPAPQKPTAVISRGKGNRGLAACLDWPQCRPDDRTGPSSVDNLQGWSPGFLLGH